MRPQEPADAKEFRMRPFDGREWVYVLIGVAMLVAGLMLSAP